MKDERIWDRKVLTCLAPSLSLCLSECLELILEYSYGLIRELSSTPQLRGLFTCILIDK